MKKLLNRSLIEVKEVDYAHVSWGGVYSLYTDENGTYYVDADDSSREIEVLRIDEGQEVADAFKEHIEWLEKEVASME